MHTMFEVLIGVGMLAVIAWPAIMLTLEFDAIRRYRVSREIIGDVRHYLPNQPRLVWWQHLVRLPLYAVFITALALVNFIILPPMLLVELPARMRAKFSAHRQLFS